MQVAGVLVSTFSIPSKWYWLPHLNWLWVRDLLWQVYQFHPFVRQKHYTKMLCPDNCPEDIMSDSQQEPHGREHFPHIFVIAKRIWQEEVISSLHSDAIMPILLQLALLLSSACKYHDYICHKLLQERVLRKKWMMNNLSGMLLTPHANKIRGSAIVLGVSLHDIHPPTRHWSKWETNRKVQSGNRIIFSWWVNADSQANEAYAPRAPSTQGQRITFHCNHRSSEDF